MEYPKLWKITAEGKESWFSAETSLLGENFEVFVRSNGHVELSKVVGEITQTVNISNLDALIARLQWLLFMSEDYFGGEWPQ